jgi:hypothetical protein
MTFMVVFLIAAVIAATVYDLRHSTQRIRVPEWEHLRD